MKNLEENKLQLTDKILGITDNDIRVNLESSDRGFNKKDSGKDCNGRYASFDYCFNYFHSFKDKRDIANPENIQTSCLQLAFYLASWGMLRGSTFLLQKSIKFYKPLIRYISNTEDSFWAIDVNKYSEENIKKLIACRDKIKEILGEGVKRNVTDTQITKIMLGVFGNVPAFDTNFRTGSNLKVFNEDSLRSIYDFYKKHADLIDKEADKRNTFDFKSEVGYTARKYTEAKIIDTIFFVEGDRIGSLQKR